MKRTIIITFTSILFVVACKTAKKTEITSIPPPPPVNCGEMAALTYADIQPILDKSCNKCHSNGGTGGYDFTVLNDVLRSGSSGELLGTIKWKAGYPRMPADAPKLDEATIAKIECWINNGMKK